MSESTSRDVRATVVRVILVITVGVEAALVGGYGLILVVDSLTQKATEAGAGAALAATAAVLCAGLVLVARAAARTRRGARAPIIVWQILQAALAREGLSAGSAWGVLLIVLAVVAVAGAFWPGVLRDAPPG
ncbi:MAG TPA: hypothetical protein VI248_27265 [Kineosporiaceae bacterium]